jgi:hypothetical protein
MNRDECISTIVKAMQSSEYYESDRGTRESYDDLVDENLEALRYIKENLK